MNRIETVKILEILRASYPAFYSKISKPEIDTIVSVWQESFADKPAELVAVAVKSLLKTHTGYPPDIAAVYAEIKSVTSAALGEPTDEELWNIYKRAVEESGYCENQTFDKLPEILRIYCGTARTLYEHAMMQSETFNTVLHGQFLKQIPVIRSRKEYRESLPEGMKELIAGLAAQKSLPPAEQMPTPQEINEKRNNLLGQLESKVPAIIKKPEKSPLTAEEKEYKKAELLEKLK